MKYAVSDISARSPDMSDAEFAEFVADIKKNGQLVPIWVRGTEVIDGRKRLAACKQLGIKPKIVNLDPLQDAERVSRALNALRTHYTPSQRVTYAASRASAKGQGQRTDLRINTQGEREVSVKDAAAEVGVSPSYVSKARQVIRDGAPEVVGAVKAGKLTVNAARQIILNVPKEEQAATVVKVVEGSSAAVLGPDRQSPAAT